MGTTVGAEEVAAPGVRRRWPSLAILAELVLVLALAAGAVVVLQRQAQRQAFTVDESRWIATSRYFWITFLDRDLVGPAWEPGYVVFTHPPVARYLIGFGLWLQGWSPDQLNGRYDTDRSRDANRRAGNIPSRELLDDARRVVLVFAVGATLLLYPIGRNLAGPVAGAAAVGLALANPLLSTLWTRALAESVLAFFSLLAILLAMHLARSTGRGRTRFALPLSLGIAVGLAAATKLSGALVGVGLLLDVLLRQAVRWWRDRTWMGIDLWTDAALAAALTFILVNPVLYPNPAVRTLMLFEHRRVEMQQQAAGTPRLAVSDDLSARAGLLLRRTFRDWGTLPEWSSVPLDAPLAGLGLGLVLHATWRAIRRREPFGPPTLLLCWALVVYVGTAVNFGFDSSHYVAPPVLVAILLEAVALTILVGTTLRLVRRSVTARRRPTSAA